MNKQGQTLPPWVQGPFELIRHADEHLKLAGDTDRRIALIGFDNAIEICIDVFVSLHPKVRGGIELPNEQIEKAKRNYHTKLEFFYQYAKERKILVEIPIEDIIWYHQLRNQLYHSGNGLIPEKHILLGARAAAMLIFRSLFNLDLAVLLENETKDIGTSDNETLVQWLREDINNLRQVGIQPRAEAELIRKILRSQGHLILMQNKNMPERFYRVCKLPISGYGIQIVAWDMINETWHEVTAFSKSRLNDLDGIKKYLHHLGCTEYEGELPKPILL